MNWVLLLNSFLVSGLTTLLSVAVGLMAALWLAGLETGWRMRWLAVAIVALCLPPFLVTNCWLHYLGHGGVWQGWLPLDIYSRTGTVLILTLLTWPITLFAVLGAWQRLEASQLESDPAVTGGVLVRGLLLPLARGALTQAAVLTFVLALNNFAVPAILQEKVFPAEVWVSFNTTFNTLAALQMSWPMVVVPLLLLIWFRRRETAWPRVEGAVPAKIFRRQLGAGWFRSCAVGTVLVAALSVGLPLVQLASTNRTWTELPGAVAAGQSAIWNSFAFAAAGATVCLVLGLVGWQFMKTASSPQPSPPLGEARGFAQGWRMVLRKCGRVLDWPIGLALWLPFLVPGVLLGIGMIVVFNRPIFSAFYQSAGIVILAFGIRYLAFGWNGVAHAMRTTDRDLADVARLNGASRWQMLRHVHWPQISSQLAALWYVIFLLCLWDVESIVLIVPPGGETLALRVFNLLHYGHNSQVNALCLVLLAVAVAPLGGWWIANWSFRTGTMRIADWKRRGVGLLVLILAAVGLAGCSQENARERVLESKIFGKVQVIGSRGAGVGEFNKPRSVAVDRDDNLYVVDMTGRVQKFSPDGKYLLQWQMPQTELGKAKGMGCDKDGNILVVEPHYQRVNHFSPDGKLVAQWGQHGTNAGQLTLPRSITVDSHGNIFLSEYTVVDRVQEFSSDGKKLLNIFGQPGTGRGEFNRAEGLGIDAADRLYVADSCNHRIQVFGPDGKWLREYGKAGSGPGELSYPYDIRVDEKGRQYVCEFGNSRIQIFDAQDRVLEILGGPGGAPGQFSNPWSIALDSKGNLYVADSQNHRVQKFLRRENVAGGDGKKGIVSAGSQGLFTRLVLGCSLPPHPSPVASQARHDSVSPYWLCASRNVVPWGEGETTATPARAVLGGVRVFLNAGGKAGALWGSLCSISASGSSSGKVWDGVESVPTVFEERALARGQWEHVGLKAKGTTSPRPSPPLRGGEGEAAAALARAVPEGGRVFPNAGRKAGALWGSLFPISSCSSSSGEVWDGVESVPTGIKENLLPSWQWGRATIALANFVGTGRPHPGEMSWVSIVSQSVFTPPHPSPMASQARHELVSPYGLCASRNVVPQWGRGNRVQQQAAYLGRLTGGVWR